MSQLSLALAQSLIHYAEQYASQLSVNVCIAIVDDGAHLIAFQRMDGTFKGAIDVSLKKAKTSALFPFSSDQFGSIIQDKQLLGMENSNDGLACFSGGIPIRQNGISIGAIGISGASAAQDAEIAATALKKAGL